MTVQVTASGEDIPEPTSVKTTSRVFVDRGHADEGFTLIAPFNGNEIQLVDRNGAIIHEWKSNRFTKGTVELLPDGTLLRGRSGQYGGPDGLQILDWDGTVLWDYTPPSDWNWHHDIEPMPNGNILINVQREMQHIEAVELGRDPSITAGLFCFDPIYEISPNGTSKADIVWEWDPLDHCIQDYYPDLPNYGNISDHPELVDINYPERLLEEWQHSNAIAYNAELDQVMITNRFFDELWVIDHNTTTEEAANHTGGAQGRGGDIIYRWGNPEAYGAGNVTDRILFGPHDAHWIGPGLPGEGNILVFNNGNNVFDMNPEGNFSSVEEIFPPINTKGGYDLDNGSAYGPSTPLMNYTADPPGDFFVWAMGSSERLPDGNTLISGGSTGYNFEVNTENEVVWELESDALFKMSRYYPPKLKEVPHLSAVEDVVLKVDLSSYISDLDTDHGDLMIGVNTSYASVSGQELQLLYPDGITKDVINLTVSDGIFEVGREVRVVIEPVNDPPVLAPIPDFVAVEGTLCGMDLHPYVLDPDTPLGDMDITVNTSYATLKKGTLWFLYPDGILTERVKLQVSDGEFKAKTEFQVNVTPVNTPPVVSPVPNQEGVEDVPWTIDLGVYITDFDTPAELISIASNSRYTTVEGLSISFLYPEGVTSDLVMVAITDGESATIAEINVTVTPVNDGPTISTISPLSVVEDEPFLVDIGPYIHDVDTPMEDLTVAVESPFIEVEGHTLRLLYPEGILEDELVVQVWDGELSASTTLSIEVEPVNDAPRFLDVPPVKVIEDEPFVLDLGSHITDVDSPIGVLTLWVESQFIEVDDLTLRLLYPDGVREDEVVVQVWDGELSTTTTLSIEVEPVNDPPRWEGSSDIQAMEDVDLVFNLDPYLMDIDTPSGEIVVEADSLYGRVEGHVLKARYPEGVLEELVTLTFTDGENRVVQRIRVAVIPVNDAPVLDGGRVDPPQGSVGDIFTFRVVFLDVDQGSSTPVVNVVIDGSEHHCIRDETDAGGYQDGVTFLFETALGPGEHTFRFGAEDGDGGTVTTDPLTVVVQEAPGKADPVEGLANWTPGMIIGAVVLMIALLTWWRRGLPGTRQ